MIIFQEFLFTFGWAIVGALSMAVSLAIMIKIFNWLTPVDEWQEMKNGNIAIAITMASVILSAALVISNAIS